MAFALIIIGVIEGFEGLGGAGHGFRGRVLSGLGRVAWGFPIVLHALV